MAFLASLGGGEVVAIFVVALVLFGPRRLPEIARTIGRWYSRLQRALNEFQQQLMAELPHIDQFDDRESENEQDIPHPPEQPPPAG